MSHQDRVFFGNFLAVLLALIVAAVIFFFIADKVADEGMGTAPGEAVIDEMVADNIRPIGKVRLAGDETPVPAPATTPTAQPAPVAARSGQDVYNASCMSCHATGAAGAPRVGDSAAWASRIAQGMEALMNNAINGLNAMPPKGLCMDCSAEELRAAVEHMVSSSQ